MSDTPQKPRVVQFPRDRPLTVRESLQKAIDADLPNVIVISQLDDGRLIDFTDPSMTLASINYILDLYKKYILNPESS